MVERITDSRAGWVAYVNTRDCGATTDVVTNVAVGRVGKKPADAVIVFTADADHGKARQDNNRVIWLRGVWTRPGVLSITYAEGSRVFRKLQSVPGATIEYRGGTPLDLPPVP
jgi:hypothetical protein